VESNPTVSIVMPVHNSAATVSAAVASCLAQDYPAVVEVVLAEGRSTDASRAVIERLAVGEARLRIVDNPSGSTPAALNAAIRASSGDVIVRCDAHSELPVRYVATAVARLAATGAGVVGGVQDAVGDTAFERAVAYAMAHPLGSGGAAYRGGGEPGTAETVYLGAFRRSALVEVGLYDESLKRNQDYELNHRLAVGGHPVFFDPALRVRYRPRGTIRRLWRQYYEYGRWKRLVVRRLPDSLRSRQLAAPALVVAAGASAVLAVTPWRAAAPVIPGLYAAAILSSSVVEMIRRKDGAGLLVAVVLPTMHVGWGAGFWRGGIADEGPRVASLQ
jgi:glycosyltransferase involved in cell wall biosynthesis